VLLDQRCINVESVIAKSEQLSKADAVELNYSTYEDISFTMTAMRSP
jgi:hypothetical protein